MNDQSTTPTMKGTAVAKSKLRIIIGPIPMLPCGWSLTSLALGKKTAWTSTPRRNSLERKPYPSLLAISNVFELALRRNPEIAGYNPLALWDTHFVRELGDSGYIDRLYAQKKAEHQLRLFLIVAYLSNQP